MMIYFAFYRENQFKQLDPFKPEDFLSRHFLRLRSELRPPLLCSSANPRPGSGGQDALLNDFQFFARGMTERFSSRSNATQLVLYLA
jgi:hypothetical protein